jgi:hypothetical protein
MDSIEYFNKDLKGQSGGILILDDIDNNKILVLGKSNVPKRMNQYESFGGKVEKTDITSLHTAIREFVEEFFNIKISTENINMLALHLRQNKIILKQKQFYGMAYLINLNGLNEIFQKLCIINESLSRYNINNKFDLTNYINERTIMGISNEGLNEIQSIHIVKLDDIKENKIKLKWYTNKIISKMIK